MSSSPITSSIFWWAAHGVDALSWGREPATEDYGVGRGCECANYIAGLNCFTWCGRRDDLDLHMRNGTTERFNGVRRAGPHSDGANGKYGRNRPQRNRAGGLVRLRRA